MTSTHTNAVTTPAMSAGPTPRSILSTRSAVVIVTAIIAGVLYAQLSTASRAFCPGGFSSDGGFIDANGAPTDAAPSRLSLVLQPSGVVYLCIAVIAITAVLAARRLREVPERASAILGLAVAAIMIVPAASAVLGQTWLASYPLLEWRPGDTVVVDVPINVTIETSTLVTVTP